MRQHSKIVNYNLYYNFSIAKYFVDALVQIGNDGKTDRAVDHEIHVWPCLTTVDHAVKTQDDVRTQRCHYSERD